MSQSSSQPVNDLATSLFSASLEQALTIVQGPNQSFQNGTTDPNALLQQFHTDYSVKAFVLPSGCEGPNPLSTAGFDTQEMKASTEAAVSARGDQGSLSKITSSQSSAPADPTADNRPENTDKANGPKNNPTGERSRLHRSKVTAGATQTVANDSRALDTVSTSQSTDASSGTAATPKSPVEVVPGQASDDSATKPEKGVEAKSPGAGDLAFAIRVQNGDAKNPNMPPIPAPADPNDAAEMSSSSAFVAQLDTLLPPLSTPRTIPGLASLTNENPMLMLADESLPVNSSNPQSSSGDDLAAQPDISVVTEVAKETQVMPTLKTVQVQVAGNDDQKVELRMVERSGTLSMSVRSSDPNLTKALQQNLPELTNRLDEQQIRAEWWKPEATEPLPTNRVQIPASSENGSSSNSDQGGREQSDPGQRQPGKSQPDWLDELNAPRKPSQIGAQFSWQL